MKKSAIDIYLGSLNETRPEGSPHLTEGDLSSVQIRGLNSVELAANAEMQEMLAEQSARVRAFETQLTNIVSHVQANEAKAGRKCWYAQWDQELKGTVWKEGRFFTWSSQYEELSNGIGHYPAAVFQNEKGDIDTRHVANIRFVKPEIKQE